MLWLGVRWASERCSEAASPVGVGMGCWGHCPCKESMLPKQDPGQFLRAGCCHKSESWGGGPPYCVPSVAMLSVTGGQQNQETSVAVLGVSSRCESLGPGHGCSLAPTGQAGSKQLPSPGPTAMEHRDADGARAGRAVFRERISHGWEVLRRLCRWLGAAGTTTPTPWPWTPLTRLLGNRKVCGMGALTEHGH